MNIKGPKGRGAYSAIVYEDGDLYVADDDVGTLIKEDSDVATVIQQAIDDYAVNGLVLVKPEVTLTSALTIQKSNSRVDFLNVINLASGVTGFVIGDTTHIADNTILNLQILNGVNESGTGIDVSNMSVGQINWTRIINCSIGLYLNACSGGAVCDNRLEGLSMGAFSTAGVQFSSAVGCMEGNHFLTSIYDSPIGFELISGGNSRYQTFIGTLDCIGTAGSEDIKDAVGHQLFICDFVRRETCTIAKDTLLFNMYAADRGANAIEMRSGSADLMNIGFVPLLIWDFNRDSTGDWTKNNCTMGTPSKSVTRLTANGEDPYITRDIEVDGGQASVIIIRYKYISGDSADTNIYYSTSGHGFSASYYKQTPGYATDGEWHMLVLDMSDLTVGGTDWIDNTITALRYDFAESSTNAVFDIDYIAIGGRGYGSMYHMDDALKTPASAAAQGNKGDIRWDASYIYICTATDTWKRVAIATW